MIKFRLSKQKNSIASFAYATMIAVIVALFSTYASADTNTIGYFPDWAAWFVNSIEYDKITHLNYFSIEPYEDGELNTVNITPSRLQQVVTAANAAGVTVSITVGGGGRSSGFSAMASDPVSRANFIQNMVDFVDQYNLDGIDLNWEPGGGGVEPDSYSTLIEELRTALGTEKLLSTAVNTWTYNIRWWAVDDLDWIEIMAYDMNWPSADHASFEDAVAAMNFWEMLPASKDKLVMGVPFYGRKDASNAQTYAWIVDTYNPLPSEDFVGGYGFNGIDTIQTKTAYVYDNGYAGIMIWNLSQDKQDQTSLLAAIDSKTEEYTPPNHNPMIWAEEPSADGDTSISMTAATATDPNGVEYYFACTSGQPEGSNSGWQDSPSYTDTGLQPATTYSYKVKARDKSINQNETDWSVIESATTTGVLNYPTTLHVHKIRLSVKPNNKGRAKVVIRDNFGNLVPGAEVTGTFSGDFNEEGTATTNNRGRAKFITSTAVINPSFTFTVDNVTHATLEYNPEDNVETSKSYPY